MYKKYLSYDILILYKKYILQVFKIMKRFLPSCSSIFLFSSINVYANSLQQLIPFLQNIHMLVQFIMKMGLEM